jgi:hypothetical protein
MFLINTSVIVFSLMLLFVDASLIFAVGSGEGPAESD